MAKLTEMRPHIVDRRPTKINQERDGEIEKGKAIELSAMDRASGRERENGENVLDQKQIGPIPFSFKPKQPSPNRHELATQPITIKPRLKFNPTQAKPTTKIYLKLYFS